MDTKTYTDIIDAARREDPVLNGLSSTSTTAEYRLWQNAIGTAMAVFAQIVDKDKEDIQNIVEANRGVGTAVWYVQRALEFQWSAAVRYSLVVDDNGYARYPEVVMSDRVVAQASAVMDTDGALLLKVATVGQDDALCPLSDDVFGDFKNYVLSLAFPAQRIKFVNQKPDTLTVIADVYYQAQSNATGLRTELLTALADFTKNTAFNGRIYTSAVVDALQGVSGVTDVDIRAIRLTDAQGVTTDINRMAVASAGYFNIDADTSITLKTE